MQCPNGDGELLIKSQARDRLNITYHHCPTCHGFWVDAFNANYLKTEDLASEGVALKGSPTTLQPICPQCHQPLTITHGENIPQNVQTWKCPNNHGYFFPKGELFKFKKAQEAKINYFKLWSIPFPKVASVLLAVFVFFIVSVSLVTIQQRKSYQLQAKNILTSHAAYVANRSVDIAAITNAKTVITVHIGAYQQNMSTKDYLVHELFISNLIAGRYDYYFTFTVGGTTIRSDTFSFVIQ